MSEAAATPADGRRETTIEECASWRERAGNGVKTRTIAATTGFSRSTVGKHIRNGEGCSHDTEAATGVAPLMNRGSDKVPVGEAHIEVVCEELTAQLTRNVGDVIHARAGVVANNTPLSGRRAGAVLATLAERECHGLVAERANPESNRASWKVWFVEDGDGR